MTVGPRPAATKPNVLAPGLYLVATPIGNLRDITLRALDVLAGADLVLAEDTRVSGKLLAAHGISKRRCERYDEHAAARARPASWPRWPAGARVALISDAGTPLISDPGYRLVSEAVGAGIAGVPDPRALGGPGGADRRRPAHRPLPVRRLPAAQEPRRRASFLGELAACARP